MTTSPPPEGPVPDVDPIDEVASALVDGEAVDATGVDGAAVAARRATFDAIARRIGEPVAPPADADRERAILRALAAADDIDATGAGADGERSVAAPLHRPARRRTGAPAWFPAAAAVAVVVAGLSLIVAALGSSTDDDDSASSDVETAATFGADDAESGGDADTSGAAGFSEEADGAGEGATEDASEAAPSAGGTARPLPFATTLGDHPDVASLDAAARAFAAGIAAQRDSNGAGSGSSGSPESTGSDAPATTVVPAPCADRFGVSAVAAATAVFEGRPVVVVVFEAPDGAVSYLAVDPTDCATQLVAGDL